MPTANQLAQAIVNAHAALALGAAKNSKPFEPPALIPQGQSAIKYEVSAEVYQATHLACLALNFDEADAQVIARAWQRQTERTGVFDPLVWPVQAQDFGLAGSTSSTAFAPCPPQLGLYAVLPDAAWVGRLARAGVPTVQLRFKSHDPEAVAREVHAAVQAVQGTPARLFINDHWQAAIEAGAYGVHLGQEDLQTLTASDLASIRRAGLRLGLSSHGYAEMMRAAAVQPSYIALGAVFATTLKRMATPPQGVARLTMYAQLLRQLPTVAIGGIDLGNLAQVLDSGVGSVAVVRALVAAAQPEAMVAAFQAQIDQKYKRG
jgi:thiamine-phosphate pyrophosphorylase